MFEELHSICKQTNSIDIHLDPALNGLMYLIVKNPEFNVNQHE